MATQGDGRAKLGVKPNTPYQYAIGGPYRPSTPLPSFGISGTKTTTFDLKEMSVGCFQDKTDASDRLLDATNCQFTVQCYTPDRHAGPVLYSYVAGTSSDAPMMRLTPDFQYCTTAQVNLYTSDAGLDKTYLAIDSILYTAREGEVFP